VDQGDTHALLGQDRVDLSFRPLGPDARLEVPVRLPLPPEMVRGYQFPLVVSGTAHAFLADSNAHVPYRLQAVAQILIPPPGPCSPAP
jgi:hypothetical protein